MKRKSNGFSAVFILVMLLFAFGMAGYVLARAGLDFRLDDTRRSLETSQGRERKQQAEYDEVVAQLPLTRAELAETQPKADAAAEEVKTLKEERKRLRAEKKELETAIAAAGGEANSGAGDDAGAAEGESGMDRGNETKAAEEEGDAP